MEGLETLALGLLAGRQGQVRRRPAQLVGQAVVLAHAVLVESTPATCAGGCCAGAALGWKDYRRRRGGGF
eukprot:4770980-Alexandrium_andersonii.AAC.1